MISILVSTVAFVLASYFLKRYFDDADIPRSFARSTVIFVIALGLAYAVAAVVDWVVA